MQSQNSYKWIFDLTKKDFSTLVASSMTSLEKKGWDPLRRATILSSWRKAKLDFGFDKMMNLSLFNLQYLIDSESNLSNPIRA